MLSVPEPDAVAKQSSGQRPAFACGQPASGAGVFGRSPGAAAMAAVMAEAASVLLAPTRAQPTDSATTTGKAPMHGVDSGHAHRSGSAAIIAPPAAAAAASARCTTAKQPAQATPAAAAAASPRVDTSTYTSTDAAAVSAANSTDGKDTAAMAPAAGAMAPDAETACAAASAAAAAALTAAKGVAATDAALDAAAPSTSAGAAEPPAAPPPRPPPSVAEARQIRVELYALKAAVRRTHGDAGVQFLRDWTVSFHAPAKGAAKDSFKQYVVVYKAPGGERFTRVNKVRANLTRALQSGAADGQAPSGGAAVASAAAAPANAAAAPVAASVATPAAGSQAGKHGSEGTAATPMPSPAAANGKRRHGTDAGPAPLLTAAADARRVRFAVPAEAADTPPGGAWCAIHGLQPSACPANGSGSGTNGSCSQRHSVA